VRVVGGAWRGRALRAPGGRATRPTSDRVREAVFDVVEDLVRRAEDGSNGGLPPVPVDVVSGAAPDGVPGAAPHGAPGGPFSGGAAAALPGPLAGRHVLDLFAGSGALGIEALSRGAAHCTFVERGRPALQALRANLEAVGVEVPGRRRATASPPPGHVTEGRGVGPASAPGRSGPGARPAPTARIRAADARRALVADARDGEMYTLVLADPPYARYEELEGDLARLLAPLLAPGALVVLETRREQAVRLPWRVLRVKRYGDTQVVFMAAGATAGASAGSAGPAAGAVP